MSRIQHVRSLDGLRAVAVVLVVLFHLEVPGFGSGYLGVDVFFVLSGFLITSLLVAEHRERQRISLPAFWVRRVRRLMPALAIVLVVTALVTAATATRSEKEAMRGDLLSTTFYVANWHFISESDYFVAGGSESPLEHTWSLAIEEQFYFFWPITIGLLLLAGRRWRAAPLVGTAVAASASAVLLYARWAPDAVERAYMGTDSKVFEPLLGAGVALLMQREGLRRLVTRRGVTIEAVAFAAAVAAVVAVAHDPPGYFTYGALAISVATASLVAVLSVQSGGFFQRVLELRPAVWIGALSYGIYLWHWPFITWLGVRSATGTGAASRSVLAAVLTVVTAAASFYLVERPIRGARMNTHLSVRKVAIGVPALLGVIAGVSIVETRVPPVPPGTPVILLAGDSVPQRLLPHLEREAESRGWVVVSATRGGCPVTGTRVVFEDGSELASGNKCPHEVRPRQDAAIRKYDPDVVIWWDRFSIADWTTPRGHHVRAGTEEFWERKDVLLESNVTRLGNQGATVVFVGTEPPGNGIWTKCRPEKCGEWFHRMIDHYDDLTTPWNATMEDFAESHPDLARFVSITDTVCRHDEAPCDDRVGGEPARPDGRHYEGDGAELAAEALLDELAPIVAGA